MTFTVNTDGTTDEIVVTQDSTMNTIRPIANLLAYAYPGNVVQTGGGISFQNLTWNIHTQRWYCNYSISAMAWYGASTNTNNAISPSYGILGGILNNIILIGPAYNPILKKFQVVGGLGLNIN